MLQEIDEQLAICEKATAGPWTETGLWLNASIPFESNDRAFIASARTVCPKALRCLKTAIEGLLVILDYSVGHAHLKADKALTTLINQWEEIK